MHAASRSDRGRQREDNQDACGAFVHPNGEQLWVLADGMGGHAGGARASQLVIEQVSEAFLASDVPPEERLKRGLDFANDEVYGVGLEDESLRGMGSTAAALLIEPCGRAWVAWVGDSRIYRARNDVLTQLSADHSVVADFVRIGVLTPEEAETHPKRNELTRAIGVAPDVETEIDCHELIEGDRFMLCSDGLSGVVPHARIERHLLDLSPDRAAQALVDEANAEGGPDNVTVQVVWYGETSADAVEAEAPEDDSEAVAVAAVLDTIAEELSEEATFESADTDFEDPFADLAEELEVEEKAPSAADFPVRTERPRGLHAPSIAAGAAIMLLVVGAVSFVGYTVVRRSDRPPRPRPAPPVVDRPEATMPEERRGWPTRAPMPPGTSTAPAHETPPAVVEPAEPERAEASIQPVSPEPAVMGELPEAAGTAAADAPGVVLAPDPEPAPAAEREPALDTPAPGPGVETVEPATAIPDLARPSPAGRPTGSDAAAVPNPDMPSVPVPEADPPSLAVPNPGVPSLAAPEPEPATLATPPPPESAAPAAAPPSSPTADVPIEVAGGSPPPPPTSTLVARPRPLPTSAAFELPPDVETFLDSLLRAATRNEFETYRALGFPESEGAFQRTFGTRESYRLSAARVDRRSGDRLYLDFVLSYVFENDDGRYRTEDPHRLILRTTPDGLRYEGRWQQ